MERGLFGLVSRKKDLHAEDFHFMEPFVGLLRASGDVEDILHRKDPKGIRGSR
jgi:hypothetical protein